MKVRVDIDMTPEELRKLMGLPDVEAFNRDLMDDIRSRMQAGAEGYDPLNLFQSYLTTSMAGMDIFRKFMSTAMSGFKPGQNKDSD